MSEKDGYDEEQQTAQRRHNALEALHRRAREVAMSELEIARLELLLGQERERLTKLHVEYAHCYDHAMPLIPEPKR